MFVGQVLEGGDVFLEGGVGDEDVQAAEGVQRRLDRHLGEGGIGDIALEHHGAATLGLDGGFGGFGVGVLVQMADDHVAALAREQDGDRTADAGIGAGDQGGEPVQLARPLPEGRVVKGRGIQRGLVARLGLVLSGEGRFGVGAGAGLHRAGGFVIAGRLVLCVDVALDGAFLIGDVFGARVGPVVHGVVS